MKQGLLHIYCGDGKGKTSAATGLAVRAAGTGMHVLFARFLKNESSGELKILDQIEKIDVIHMTESFGFYKYLSSEEQEKVREVYGRLWNEIEDRIQEGAYDLLVIDEFMAAYNYGMIPHEQALEFLKNRPEGLEVALTGRNPGEELVAIADYVSEVKKIKHPYDQGIVARKGIEY